MEKKVLVADDDPVVCILMTEFLSSKGFQVETSQSGQACLDRLNQELPDVLLLDLLMPDMTGIDVLRRLRGDPRTASLPIVILSADTDTESVMQSNNVAASAYLHKPFGAKEVMAVVEQVLK